MNLTSASSAISQRSQSPNNQYKAIKESTLHIIQLLQTAEDSVIRLTQLRIEAKCSTSRVNGVGKEIRELIKVLAEYC